MQDDYKEVVIVLVSAIFLFLTLAGIIIFFLFSYQKKRFAHHQQVSRMRQLFDQEILQARLEIQESTLNNISSEIHDNVGQLLSLATVQLNIINQSKVIDKGMLLEVKESVASAMSELRDIAKSLSGTRMQELGLLQALSQEVERLNRSKTFEVTLSVSGELRMFSEQRQLIIFRIVQECLQNILKHAEAKLVTISLVYTGDVLELTVLDDGKGFQGIANESNGLGLRNITERAALMDGNVIIASGLYCGTKIKLNVPYE